MAVRISAPTSAKKGDVIELKALIQHPMESGYRRDLKGEIIPLDIIEEFVCTYSGKEVFRWELQRGISANPFITFFIRAIEPGPIEFRWTDQHGVVTTETRQLNIT